MLRDTTGARFLGAAGPYAEHFLSDATLSALNQPLVSPALLLDVERCLRGLGAMLFWLRLGQVFTLSKRTGPLLKMVMVVTEDILEYLAVQSLFVIAFASFFATIVDTDKTSDELFGNLRGAAGVLVRCSFP